MSFFRECLKGVVIGAGAILPGISSGVLCVVFGIYEKLLDAVLNFFKDIKQNTKFLFPIIIGVGIGVLLFSNILNYLLYTYPIQIKSCFIGLIIGSIPSLVKDANQTEKFKWKNIIYMVTALGLGLIMVYIEKNVVLEERENISFIYLCMSGFLMSIGVVVPGVSSTVILMLMGVYTIYLQSISNLYLPVLIPIGMGLILGGILVMKITKKLFDKHYCSTIYAIIGFTLGSVLVLFPEITTSVELMVCILCIICGIQVASIRV